MSVEVFGKCTTNRVGFYQRSWWCPWNWEDSRGGFFRDNVILFFLQQNSFEPRVTWINSRDTRIVSNPQDISHGLCEFTMEDLNGHQFRVYKSLEPEGEDA